MPKIKVEKVISFSTEDPGFPASNILDPDPSKKWKCQSPGEKCASLVLQLEKATSITSIDIGNEHSAYIEVLVSRSESSDDYKVLLVMSSFMTPIEARQGTNPAKVRMFTYEQLSSPERDEKWDRIKIVCTQPFNRHVQYGLAFASFASSEAIQGAVQPHIGNFLVRSDSPTNLSAGSLFARRNELEDKPLSAAAAIREASASPSQNLNLKKLKVTQSLDKDASSSTSRNRQELLYNDDDSEPNAKIDALMQKRDKEKEEREAQEKKEREAKDKKEREAKEKKEKQAKEFLEGLEKEAKLNKQKKEAEEKKKVVTPNKAPINIKNQANGESSGSKESHKRKLKKEKTAKQKTQVKKPFHRLLEGVVFAISGIQNPERANIRSMALSMGAKYKSDWDNSCTHLICAFTNTPKFNQVRGNGKIITRHWIPACNAQRKRLPWRRYALDRKDQKKPESEDEIKEGNSSDDAMDNSTESDTDAELETMQKKFKKNGVILDSPSITPSPTLANIDTLVEDNKEDDDKNSMSENENKSNQLLSIYDCDTEEEGDFCLKTTEVPVHKTE